MAHSYGSCQKASVSHYMGLYIRLLTTQTIIPQSKWSVRKPQFFYELALEVTNHHFCHILLVTQATLVHGKKLHKEWIPRVKDHWEHSLMWSITVINIQIHGWYGVIYVQKFFDISLIKKVKLEFPSCWMYAAFKIPTNRMWQKWKCQTSRATL